MAEQASSNAPKAEGDAFLPALRFRVLTPLFDAVVRTTMREETFKRSLIGQAMLQPGQTVLDLGCGTGTLALMAKQAQPRCDVIGVDADPEILEIARRKAQAEDTAVTFDASVSTELPYEDASVDRVLSTLFFHHLTPPDKRQTLREIRRVLRPGGELHVADFTVASDPLQRLLSWQVRLFDGRERTEENFTGELPRVIADAGLGAIAERRRLRTGMGTLALFSTPPIPKG